MIKLLEKIFDNRSSMNRTTGKVSESKKGKIWFWENSEITKDYLLKNQDFISYLPDTSIIAKWDCGGYWSAGNVSGLQVGDIPLTRTLVHNLTTDQSCVFVGSIPNNNGHPVGPVVKGIDKSVLKQGLNYFEVTSYSKGSGNKYTTSIISGKYGVTQRFQNSLPLQMMFVKTSGLNSSFGFLWTPTLPLSNSPCVKKCGTLQGQPDCPAFVFGPADHFKSVNEVKAVNDINNSSFSFSISQDAKTAIRETVGSGTCIIKVCICLQGDSWTNHTQQTIDQVGHHIAMSKLNINV